MTDNLRPNDAQKASRRDFIKAVTDRNQRVNEFSLNISLKGLEKVPAKSDLPGGPATAAVAPTSREKVMQAITK